MSKYALHISKIPCNDKLLTFYIYAEYSDIVYSPVCPVEPLLKLDIRQKVSIKSGLAVSLLSIISFKSSERKILVQDETNHVSKY